MGGCVCVCGRHRHTNTHSHDRGDREVNALCVCVNQREREWDGGVMGMVLYGRDGRKEGGSGGRMDTNKSYIRDMCMQWTGETHSRFAASFLCVLVSGSERKRR